MKSKQTILPILALVASIAITMIPSALAEEDTKPDAIDAEIAEHQVTITALTADIHILDQIISDTEDKILEFESASTAYQVKLDSIII